MSKGTIFIGGTFGNEGSQGGQGGGTNNYLDLNNKPKINDVTLEGNKTSEQLGIVVPKNIKDYGTGVVEGTVANNAASGQCSYAGGVTTIARGRASHAEGEGCEASSHASHAEGYKCKALSDFSHAEGRETVVELGLGGHAEGYKTLSSGGYSHAEGQGSSAVGYNSHAEGRDTRADGNAAHAEGAGTRALGMRSHAEGEGTQANGYSSHAEGAFTETHAYASHAEGKSTQANGQYSHAEGEGTIAAKLSQHVFGSYNIAEEGPNNEYGEFIEIVGNGTGIIRSNARTLSRTGKEWLADTLEVSREPETENEVATKGYVDGKTMKRVVVDEEKLIGEWVEGGVTYDLYEKTVYFGELTNAEQKQVIHGVTNYVRFVGIRGMAISSNNNLPLPFAAVDATKNIYLAVGSSKITITPGSDRTGHNAWITLEYIKNKEVE